jgi:hypothetical protein
VTGDPGKGVKSDMSEVDLLDADLDDLCDLSLFSFLSFFDFFFLSLPSLSWDKYFFLVLSRRVVASELVPSPLDNGLRLLGTFRFIREGPD